MRKESVVGYELSIVYANFSVLDDSEHVGADGWEMDVSSDSRGTEEFENGEGPCVPHCVDIYIGYMLQYGFQC